MPYQLVLLCSGDIGHADGEEVDIEAWFPGQKALQGACLMLQLHGLAERKAGHKYDEKGESKYVHTLNSTAIATTRTLACIVENYSNEDGTITVPDVLVPYMGKKDRIAIACCMS